MSGSSYPKSLKHGRQPIQVFFHQFLKFSWAVVLVRVLGRREKLLSESRVDDSRLLHLDDFPDVLLRLDDLPDVSFLLNCSVKPDEILLRKGRKFLNPLLDVRMCRAALAFSTLLWNLHKQD